MLTLSTARNKLADYAPEESLTERINLACSLLLDSAFPKGRYDQLRIVCRDGLLALPPEYSACVGAAISDNPVPVFNQWYSVVLHGVGPNGAPGGLVDLGEGSPVIRRVASVNPYGVQLTVIGEEADDETDGAQVVIQGIGRKARPVTSVASNIITSASHGLQTGDVVNMDYVEDGEGAAGLVKNEDYFVRRASANTLTLHPTAADAVANTNTIAITAAGTGAYLLPSLPDRGVRTEISNEHLDGEVVALTTAGATTANYFTVITGVSKSRTKGAVRVYATDPVTGGKELIAVWGPSEVDPTYRHYRIPQAEDQDVVVVEALCLKRHIDLVEDDDELPVDNLAALRKAMLAVHYEIEGDSNRHDGLLADAVRLLAKESNKQTPNTMAPVQFIGHCVVPNLR